MYAPLVRIPSTEQDLMRRPSPLVLACALLLAACTAAEPVAGPGIIASTDQLALHPDQSDVENDKDNDDDNGARAVSVVVIGCNRVDTPDTNKAVNPSTANLEQLRRTFAEV